CRRHRAVDAPGGAAPSSGPFGAGGRGAAGVRWRGPGPPSSGRTDAPGGAAVPFGVRWRGPAGTARAGRRRRRAAHEPDGRHGIPLRCITLRCIETNWLLGSARLRRGPSLPRGRGLVAGYGPVGGWGVGG